MSSKKIKCPICNKEKNINQFYKSNKKAYEMFYGHCYICKKCLKDMIYVDGIPNREKMKEILRDYIDLPYIEDLFRSAIKNTKETLGTYITAFNVGAYKGKNLTWADTKSFEKENKESNNYKKENIQDDNFNEMDFEKLKRIWGETWTYEQCQRLQNFYDEFASEYETDSPVQRLNFQNAARTQLQAEQALADGNNTLFNSLIKTLSGILGDSNIKPVQVNGAEANDQLAFGLFIKKIEDEEPIPEWKDDEMKKYIDTYMVGHLAKMEGLKNKFVDLYNDSIKPWTVDFNIEEDENYEADD